MNTRYHSWKSYAFLTVSVIVTILMFLLDPIGIGTDERLSGVTILFIFVGTAVSLLMGIISFGSKNEKKLIPAIAAIFTVFNVSVISFFLWFGANFA